MWFKNKWYKYFKPLHKSTDIQFNLDSWTKSQNFYEENEYKKSLVELLKYVDKKVDEKYKISEWIYNITHWSVTINLDFSDSNIKIKTNFLDVSEANKIPLYRRIAELNFFALNLVKIKLNQEILSFEFSCPLIFYSPIKIWEALADICYLVDKYDEEFCEDYWAKLFEKSWKKEFTKLELEKIYKNFREIILDNLEIIKDLENRRKNNYAWDVISTTYKMIDYICSPKWILALKISEKVNELYDKDETLETVIFRWKEFLKELLGLSLEEFSKSIYDTVEFIPNKRVSNIDYISEYLKPWYLDAYSEIQSWRYESAYLILMHILYNSMYYHAMPIKMKKLISFIIKKYSNKKVDKKSVSKLAIEVQKIVDKKSFIFKGWLIWFFWISFLWFFEIL